MSRLEKAKFLKIFLVIILALGIIVLATYLLYIIPRNYPKAVVITVVDLLVVITALVIINSIAQSPADESDEAIIDATVQTKQELMQSQEMQLNVYAGDLTKKKCQICKISFDKSDLATRCPKCFSFYHIDHLIKWLMEHNVCPVCGTKLSYNKINL
jgi:hypothetical protein